MKDLKKWRILRSQVVFNNRWCQIRRDQVELPVGNVIDDFFVNVRPDIALVFAVTKTGDIVFVRQYRHGAGEILLELPAGAFNPEVETPASAAAREFTEETGYVCENLIKIATLYENPVKDTNKIHLFVGKDVERAGEQVLDVTEEIEVVLVPVVEVMERISAGEICVSGSVAAVFLGLNFLRECRWVEGF